MSWNKGTCIKLFSFENTDRWLLAILILRLWLQIYIGPYHTKCWYFLHIIEAVLDAPGLVLHRLSSSRGRLSWLNISGAPVYHVNINICVFFIFVSISLSLSFLIYLSLSEYLYHRAHLVILEMCWCDWKTQFKTLDLRSFPCKIEYQVLQNFESSTVFNLNPGLTWCWH